MNYGAHVDGLERALRSMPNWKRRLPRGLTAVISIDSPFFVHYSNRLGDPVFRHEVFVRVGERLRRIGLR
jgi:hypothetical protein